MNMADRIQSLRKSKGVSQEELAHYIGVSRQAVSKWESEQSGPDLENIIAISEYFQVTTDYLLKGIEAVAEEKSDSAVGSRVLYAASTALVYLGLLIGIGGWLAEQTLEPVFGSMCAQVVGLAAYFIGKALSKEQASFWVQWLNLVGLTCMPSALVSFLLFQAMPRPFLALWIWVLAAAIWIATGAAGFVLLGKQYPRR